MKKTLAFLLAAMLLIGSIPALADSSFIGIGSVVTFGSYEQDNRPGNGKEPIQWIVLDVWGNNALLLSTYVLDSQPYNTSTYAVKWNNCTLNSWLNYNFLNMAFTAQEQRSIYSMLSDQVFLLSYDEVRQYVRGRDLYGYPTAYAMSRGVYADSYNNLSWWWLRSTGTRENQAYGVNTKGVINEYHMRKESGGIRPAVWVNTRALR